MDLTFSGADLALLGGILFSAAIARALRAETVSMLAVIAVLAGGGSVSAVYAVPLVMMSIKWLKIPGV